MGDSHDVKKEVKIYIAVFVALAILTVVTVGIAYIDFGVSLGIAVGLLVATVKAALVALFFMHLKAERAMIYWVLYLTVFFFVVMIALPLWQKADQLHLVPSEVAAEKSGGADGTSPAEVEKKKEPEFEKVVNKAGPASATIKGKTLFKGAAPKRRKLAMSSSKDCVGLHGDNIPLSERYVVSPEGGLANAMVWVSQGLEGQDFTTPSEKVKFDQAGCKYTPHVFGCMTNQEIEISNSDPFMHNVHIRPKRNRVVNRSQTKKGEIFIQKFRKSETKPVRIKCDVHPWMTAYAGVFDHPYFAVTAEDGSFELPKIAAGKYVLTAWHEAAEDVIQVQVEVADNEVKEVPAFEFEEE